MKFNRTIVDWLVILAIWWMAVCIVVMVSHGQIMPPAARLAKHYKTASAIKGASLLMAKVVTNPPPMIYVSVFLPMTNTIQFSPDLQNWTTLLVTNQPAFTVSFPETNGVGFFRNVTESMYGPSSIQTSTNAPSP